MINIVLAYNNDKYFDTITLIVRNSGICTLFFFAILGFFNNNSSMSLNEKTNQNLYRVKNHYN